MPLLKSAKKKLRQDKKRTLKNKKVRELYKEMLKKAKANPTKENLAAAFSSIDKAAKEHLIHDNKAARLKSSLTKGTDGKKETKEEKVEKKGTTVKKAPAKTTKKTTKKAAK